MARKVTFNTDSSLGQFITKLNLEADYVGDLDTLHNNILNGTTFSSTTVNIPGIKDSNYTIHGVSLKNALNWIESGHSVVSAALTSGTGVVTINNIVGESASVNVIHTGTLITDSDVLILDSATFVRTSGLVLDFDSGSIDSARIDNLSGSFLLFDSGSGEPHGGSTPYWPGQGNFNILRFDSAYINSSNYKNISGDSAVYPTGVISQLTIDSAQLLSDDNLYITDRITVNNVTTDVLNFDGKALDEFTVIRITDNTGTIQLGGYLASTDNDSAIA
jgi:hypothetical protein